MKGTSVLLMVIVLVVIFVYKSSNKSNLDRVKRSEFPEVDLGRSHLEIENEKLDENHLEYSFEDFDFYFKRNKNNKIEKNEENFKSEDCRMNNCFDFEVCRKNGFKERKEKEIPIRYLYRKHFL